MFRRFTCLVSADYKFIEGRFFATYHTTSTSRSDVWSEHRNNYQPVADFYAGKSILITGGAGFLGKVFIERLLFNCSEIDKIYVILREKKGVNVKQRLQNVLDNPLFSKLKETRPNDLDKLIPITGDMESQEWGIRNNDRKTILENVSVVFHSAAEIRFHKPLKYTLKVNVEGTRELMNVCRQMNKLEAFVHLSTAFSQGERIHVDEILYPPPHRLSEVYKLLENNNSPKEMKRILNGKLNNYTFSKAIAETMVAEEHGNMPSIIVRPSMVGAMKGEPLPGWTDNWNGATGLMYDMGRGVNNILHGQRETVLGIIPVDYSVNLAIVAASKCINKDVVKVYNSCSSVDNPITCGHLEKASGEHLKKVHNGKGSFKVYYFKSPWIVYGVSFFYQWMPAYTADFWLRLKGKEPRHVQELKLAIARRNLLKRFTSTSRFWKTKNTRALYASLSQQDQKQFPFDATNICLDEYFENYFKGIYKYLNVKKK